MLNATSARGLLIKSSRRGSRGLMKTVLKSVKTKVNGEAGVC